MSVIVTEVYDALVAAGAPDEKARAAAGVIPMTETLSTKQDFADSGVRCEKTSPNSGPR